MKELKLQKSHKSGPAGRKRKKYMYFDRLLFLMPTVENKRYQLSSEKINDRCPMFKLNSTFFQGFHDHT